MHVKDPQVFVIRGGLYVPVAGFWLSLDNLHVLTRDVDTTQHARKITELYISMARVSLEDEIQIDGYGLNSGDHK